MRKRLKPLKTFKNMTKIPVIPEQDGCEHKVSWAFISIISLKASRANDTLFSRAFHTTSRYDFRAYDIRPDILVMF